MPEGKKLEVVRGVLELFDHDGDGFISREEWMAGWGRGVRLPDYGVSSPRALVPNGDNRRGGEIKWWLRGVGKFAWSDGVKFADYSWG